ncbi:MAG: hypothetical protein ABSG96_01140 [Terracidiphilus sp.]|jgi:hypothetical protein
MTDPVHCLDYFFYGLRLRSPFSLQSLPAWPKSVSEDAPDISLCFGETPDSITNPLWSSPFVQIGGDRSALVNISSVARLWIRSEIRVPHETKIIVQKAPGVQLFEIETILIGTVAGILLHLRSMLPLHASCVVLDGRAIAFSGPCASGKSALAAALVRCGAFLLSDDLCVSDFSNRAVRAAAGTTRVRLWPDVMDRFEVPPEQRLPTRLDHGKHAVAVPTAEASTWPLELLVRIEAAGPDNEPVLVRQHGLPALFPFKELVYQWEIGRSLGNRADQFRCLTAVADHAAICTLRRTKDLDHLDQCADLILNAFRGGV